MKNTLLSAIIILGFGFTPGLGFSLLSGGAVNLEAPKTVEKQKNTSGEANIKIKPQAAAHNQQITPKDQVADHGTTYPRGQIQE